MIRHGWRWCGCYLPRRGATASGIEQLTAASVGWRGRIRVEHEAGAGQGVRVACCQVDGIAHVAQGGQTQCTERIRAGRVQQRGHQFVAENGLAPVRCIGAGAVVQRNAGLSAAGERCIGCCGVGTLEARVGRSGGVDESEAGPQVAKAHRVGDLVQQDRLELRGAEAGQVRRVQRDAGERRQRDRAAADIEDIGRGQLPTGTVDVANVQADAQVVYQPINRPVCWQVPDHDLFHARDRRLHRATLRGSQSAARQLNVDLVSRRIGQSGHHDDRGRYHDDWGRDGHWRRDDHRRQHDDDRDYRRRRWNRREWRRYRRERRRRGRAWRLRLIAVAGRSRRRHAVPAWSPHARVWIGNHRLAIGRDGAGAVDHQHASGVVEAEDVQLGPWRGIEHVRERDLHRLREGGDPRCLDRDVEGVLQHARRQHVPHEFGRHGCDADLHVGDGIAVFVHGAAGFDAQRQRLALGFSERRGGLRVVGGDDRGRHVAHRLEHAGGDARQVDFATVDVGLSLLRRAHAAHHGVGDAGGELGIHHHFGEENARRCIGGGASIDRDLDGAGRHIGQFEIAVGIGKDELVFLAEDVDLGMRDRQQENVIWRVDDPVRPAPDVIEGHRLQVRARVDDFAHQLRAHHGRGADRLECQCEHASGRAIPVGIEESPVSRRADGRAVNMQRDQRSAGHGLGKEQPGKAAIGRRHDGGSECCPVRTGGVEARGCERRGVDCPAEVDLRTLGHTHISFAVNGLDRRDGERRQRIHGQCAADSGRVAGGVPGSEEQRMTADVQRSERQGGVEGPGGAVEHQTLDGSGVEAVGQLGDGRTGAIGAAGEAAGGAERVAIGQAGHSERGRLGVEREAAHDPGVDIARGIGGQDGDRVDAVGRPVGRQRRGEAEAAGAIEREGLRRAAVHPVLRTGHAREVVQHLTGDRDVGFRRCGHCAHGNRRRLGVAGQCKAR